MKKISWVTLMTLIQKGTFENGVVTFTKKVSPSTPIVGRISSVSIDAHQVKVKSMQNQLPVLSVENVVITADDKKHVVLDVPEYGTMKLYPESHPEKPVVS